MRVLGDEGFVEGVVGSPAGSFKVINGEVSFQLPDFWFHLLRVRFTLMSCQRFLGQHELVQRMRDIEIGRVLVGHERRIELFCFQLCPINLREPRLGPYLVNAGGAGSAT